MPLDKRREIASRGGRAAHEKGRAHEFTRDEAREAGRKGGLSVSRSREHMARIGRAGGLARAEKTAARQDGRAALPAIRESLEGLGFPAPKSSVLDRVGDRTVALPGGGSSRLREVLERSSLEVFHSLEEIAEEFNRLKKDGRSHAA